MPMLFSFGLNQQIFNFLVDGESTIHLYQEPLKEVVLPVDDESIWGPVVLKPLPRGSVNKCTFDKHR